MGRARLFVATDDDQLFAGKQIKRLARIQTIHRRAVFGLRFVADECEFDFGQHRRFHPAIKFGDAGFEIFVRPHVLALAVVRTGQLVEQACFQKELS